MPPLYKCFTSCTFVRGAGKNKWSANSSRLRSATAISLNHKKISFLGANAYDIQRRFLHSSVSNKKKKIENSHRFKSLPSFPHSLIPTFEWKFRYEHLNQYSEKQLK
ncbi:hypothetical protein RB195_016261 [Necator americanus]|uniref:Uncharacterized protein n=1 Tax=Necator americanus TaxID=51031 RepID=A0ABR1EA72_NECAM